MIQKIVILGAGRIGKAIGRTLEINPGHQVEYWDANPIMVPDQKSLEQIIPMADFIFFCIPSQTINGACLSISSLIKKQAVLGAFTKGIELKTLKTIDQMLCESLPDNPFAFFGGPMLAEEIENNLGGVAVVATDRKTFKKIKRLFSTTLIKLEYAKDIKAIAVASVLKNIYALSLGIADGLGWGTNIKGWLTAKAIKEMMMIAKILKINPKVILGSAGIGDFIATAFSPYSRNRASGEMIVKNGKCDTPGEGIISLPPLLDLLKNDTKKMPLLRTLTEVIINKKDAKEKFEELLKNY